MLVEWADHARAVCRLSVAEVRRFWPSAFAIFMVFSLLMADGLLPVMAAKYRTELALYSSADYGNSDRGCDDADGGDSNNGVRSASAGRMSSFSKPDARSHAGVRSSDGAENNSNRGSSGKTLSSSAYRRSKTAVVARPDEVVLDSGWEKDGETRTYSSESFKDSRLGDTHHIQLSHSEPQGVDRTNEESNEDERGRRKNRRPSLPPVRSVSAASSPYSLQPFLSLSSSSLLSSASSVSSPEGPPSAPSIYSVSSYVKSSHLKSSLKSVSSPSSLPSSSSAFSTLSFSDQISSSKNRKNKSTRNKRNNHNNSSKNINKYVHNYNKHQRLQKRGHHGSPYSLLVTHTAHDQPIRSDSTIKVRNPRSDKTNDDTQSNMCTSIYSSSESDRTLSIEVAKAVCGGFPSSDCKRVAHDFHLDFCSGYDLTSISPYLSMPGRHEDFNETECVTTLNETIETDNSIRKSYSGFQDLINRYDCTQTYSVKWNCIHCKVRGEKKFDFQLVGRMILSLVHNDQAAFWVFTSFISDDYNRTVILGNLSIPAEKTVKELTVCWSYF